MLQTNRKRFYSLIIFSLVLLINPNINVIDLMPDFIAWFILAKLFERAADSAPYFEEARVAFKRLAWVNLAKIPAFILVMLIRSKDTLDNNVYALASLSFAVIETLFIIPAVKNIFLALFHLGERTEAVSLISPFQSPICKKRQITADALKECTFFFIICKNILYFIPDLLLLTRVSDSGHIVMVSAYYPYAFIITQALGVFVGVAWFLRMRKYVLTVHNEGLFFDALSSMATEDTDLKFETKVKIRSLIAALTLFAVSSFFALELTLSFDSTSGVNILPHFIYAIFLLFTLFALKEHVRVGKAALLLAGGFLISSVVSYALTSRFLSKYQYLDLVDDKSAMSAYIPVEVLAIVEFVFLAALLLFIAKAMNRFIIEHTGMSPDNERYRRMDEEFHASLKKRNYILTGIGILSALTKCLNVFFKGKAKAITSDTGNLIISSSFPWFNIILIFTAIAYISFAFYFVSILKEEVKNKYTN